MDNRYLRRVGRAGCFSFGFRRPDGLPTSWVADVDVDSQRRPRRDGVFVLMHDETLDRTTDVEERFPTWAPWQVAEFRLDEIWVLDAGGWFVKEDPLDRIAEGNVSADDANPVR